MEGKSVVMSALGIGIGVGVGLGLASAPWAGASARAGLTVDRVEQELRRLLVDAAATKVTFDEFPYYLRFARLSVLCACDRFCTKQINKTRRI